jgi:hypothetical protein
MRRFRCGGPAAAQRERGGLAAATSAAPASQPHCCFPASSSASSPPPPAPNSPILATADIKGRVHDTLNARKPIALDGALVKGSEPQALPEEAQPVSGDDVIYMFPKRFERQVEVLMFVASAPSVPGKKFDLGSSAGLEFAVTYSGATARSHSHRYTTHSSQLAAALQPSAGSGAAAAGLFWKLRARAWGAASARAALTRRRACPARQAAPRLPALPGLACLACTQTCVHACVWHADTDGQLFNQAFDLKPLTAEGGVSSIIVAVMYLQVRVTNTHAHAGTYTGMAEQPLLRTCRARLDAPRLLRSHAPMRPYFSPQSTSHPHTTSLPPAFAGRGRLDPARRGPLVPVRLARQAGPGDEGGHAGAAGHVRRAAGRH